MTQILNLFGGPCLGKSTLAAELFSWFKKNTPGEFELITETAKDYSWEERWVALGCQPYIFGQQLFKQQKLLNKVDIIFTDSPIILSNAYEKLYHNTKFPEAVIDIFKTFDNINYLIKRDTAYNENGRHHTLAEALEVDNIVESMLITNNIPYQTVNLSEAFITIKDDILTLYSDC